MGTPTQTTAALLATPATPGAGVENLRPPTLITYAEGQVSPPSALYVGLNDLLSIRSLGHSAVEQLTVDIRILLPDGTIQIQQEVASVGGAYSPGFTQFRMAEGFLLSVALRITDSSIKRGQIFVVLALVRNPSIGNFLELELSRGYCTVLAPVAWPTQSPDFPTAKPGAILAVNVSNPAAGVDWTQAINALARWRIIAARATLTTSVTVATRCARLAFGAPGAFVFVANPAVNQLASTVFTYDYGAGITTLLAGVTPAGTAVDTAIPVDLWLPGGSQLGSSVNNIQAGDQWSAINLLIEESLDQ